MKAIFALPALLLLTACSGGPLALLKPAGDSAATQAGDDQTRPQSRPGALNTPAPPSTARTAEEFDTTSAEERAAAAAPAASGGEASLGTTVASLGDVAKPGFWLETPLVSAPAKGRVRYPGSGKSAQVDLLPIEGPASAGSRLSLAAMRLIEAPLTDLPTIEVYSGG